jgi:hypothetical protein
MPLPVVVEALRELAATLAPGSEPVVEPEPERITMTEVRAVRATGACARTPDRLRESQRLPRCSDSSGSAARGTPRRCARTAPVSRTGVSPYAPEPRPSCVLAGTADDARIHAGQRERWVSAGGSASGRSGPPRWSVGGPGVLDRAGPRFRAGGGRLPSVRARVGWTAGACAARRRHGSRRCGARSRGGLRPLCRCSRRRRVAVRRARGG